MDCTLWIRQVVTPNWRFWGHLDSTTPRQRPSDARRRTPPPHLRGQHENKKEAHVIPHAEGGEVLGTSYRQPAPNRNMAAPTSHSAHCGE